MSRCEEYRQKMLDTEAEIKRLEEWPTVRENDRNRDYKIKLLKQELVSWKHKWEQSLKYGGC